MHYVDLSDASQLGQELELIRRADVGARGRLEWALHGESLLLGYEPDVWRAGSRLQGDWSFAAQHAGWVSLEGAYDDYPQDADYEGPMASAGCGFRHSWGPVLALWDAYVLRHEARFDELSHVEQGGGAALVYSPGGRWSAGCSARASRSEFDRYEFDSGTGRTDVYLSTRVWVSWPAGRAWNVAPFAAFADNRSDEDDADYQRFMFGLDLVFGAL